jgi:hypothetical protein
VLFTHFGAAGYVLRREAVEAAIVGHPEEATLRRSPCTISYWLIGYAEALRVPYRFIAYEFDGERRIDVIGVGFDPVNGFSGGHSFMTGEDSHTVYYVDEQPQPIVATGRPLPDLHRIRIQHFTLDGRRMRY